MWHLCTWWTDFNEICCGYSSCEWVLLKRFSGLKVKGQCPVCRSVCYSGGGIHSDYVASRLTCSFCMWCFTSWVSYQLSVWSSTSWSWSDCGLPSYYVNGHMWTIWFIVCCWPHSETAESVRPNLCRFARCGTWPVQKWFGTDHRWQLPVIMHL